MRHVLAFVICMLAWPAVVQAMELTDSRPLAEVLADLPSAELPVLAEPAPEVRHVKFLDWKSGLVGAFYGIALAVDVKSTFDSSRWCPTCREGDPYAAPFINRGPAVASVATAGLWWGVMKVSQKMRESENPVLRKIWFVPPIALGLGNAWAAHHNYGLPGK